MQSQIKLGVSLYSLTREFYSKELTLEECIKTAADLGVDGIEMVGAQSVRGYPWPTDETISSILHMCEKYNIRLISYSANADRGMRSDKLHLSEDEMFEYALNDLKYAAKFGAEVQRQQHNITPSVLGRLAPYAEKYKVKVGIEIHQPMIPSDANVMDFVRVCESVQSEYIGFVPDFGSFTERPNPYWIDQSFKTQGLGQAEIDYFLKTGEAGLDVEEAFEGFNQVSAGFDKQRFHGLYERVQHKPADLEGLKRIMPYCVLFHGKFHVLDETDNDIAIPVDKIVSVIRDYGYGGYIMAEYEGHHMIDADAVPLLRRNLNFYRKVIGS
jgi:sugar phosphate isomerase/epimerase